MEYSKELSCKSYCEYLVSALSQIKYKTDTTKVDKAINLIKEAMEKENAGYPFTGLSKLKEVFPEV